MIQKTVYFRTQEDLDSFNAISNKTEWLHQRLANIPAKGLQQEGIVSYSPRDLVSAEGQQLTQAEIIRKLNENNTPACCKLKTPCRHWSYNGLEEIWENSITGDTRAVE